MFRALALATLAFTVGCAHSARVGYLQAAAVDLPQDVRTVVVIDRSGAGNFGEHVLAGMEGAATGETWRLDAESAALALDALKDVLHDGQRFEIVSLRVDGRAVDTSLWDREMTARQVRQLCRESRCDAVIALETFDSDTAVALARTDAESPRFEATQDTSVAATFRTYDGRTGRVLDEQRAQVGTQTTSSAADTPREAVGALPHDAVVFDGAAALGADYARRISPHQVVASRAIYGVGSKEMRDASKALRRGNLDRAEAVWSEVAAGSDTKLAAKATHNLAVAAEARGDVGTARALAADAARTLGKQRTDRYVAALNARAANDARVAAQLGGLGPQISRR